MIHTRSFYIATCAHASEAELSGACVKGNCAGVDTPALSLPTSHAPLRPLLPCQCLRMTNTNVLYVRENGRKEWQDGHNFRLTSPRLLANISYFSAFIIIEQGVDMWMTGVTLQGNGDGSLTCGICRMYVESGSAYVEGVTTRCPT